MLGTLTRVNHKAWMAVCGVVCIGLSMGFSYGFCSACGLFVTPVHNILPFLLLGIGIDDVFVIVQNWQLYGGGEVLCVWVFVKFSPRILRGTP